MKVKLSDIVNRINGNVDRFATELEYYVGGEHFDSSELTISRYGLLKPNVEILGFKFHFAFQEKDVLFMARNPHLRKAGMVTCSGLCSDASYILRSKDEGVITQEFLAIQLQTDHFWEYCESHKVGSVNFAINYKTLAAYEFELPPIETQKEISNKVWTAYRLKEAYKRLLVATDEMVKSQFLEWFGNPKYSESSTSLNECCLMKAGKAIKATELITEGFPCYGGNGLRGFISRYSHEGEYPIIGRQGALCGNVIMAKGQFYATEHAIVVTPKDNVTAEWLFYCLLYMDLNRLARGVAQPGLSVEQLLKQPINIQPLNLQEEFAAFARQADKSKFELKRAIEAIDKVIKSLING